MFARGIRRELHFAQPRRRISRCIPDELHDQHVVEIAEGPWNAHVRGHEAIERVDFGVLPFVLLLSSAEPRAAAHGAGFAAPTDLTALLVLRAPLEAALRHVAIDLRAAKVIARAHDVNGGFLAA